MSSNIGRGLQLLVLRIVSYLDICLSALVDVLVAPPPDDQHCRRQDSHRKAVLLRHYANS